MQLTKITIITFLVLLMLYSCVDPQKSYNQLAPGIWRATLLLDADQILDSNEKEITLKAQHGGELPFNFEVGYENEQCFITIINGEERIRLDDIEYGRDKSTAKDTVVIDFPIYESKLRAIVIENVMEGEWIVKNKDNYSIPFRAYHGQSHRFTTQNQEPASDLSGTWEVSFDVDSEEPYPAKGIFKQDGNHLTGTFLTETGDYRYLEGTVQANKFMMSCFDGSHAFLFEGKITEDNSLMGTFRSGKHYQSVWTARTNPSYTLADPYKITYLKEGYDHFDFKFPNLYGDSISLSDTQFDGKVKLVQILGSWCPNCRDESNFLVEYLQTNPSDNLEVIGLAFEKNKNPEKAIAQLKTYKEKLQIPYTLLLAGSSSKKDASQKLPMLNKVISYPTLLFIDKNNKVRKIHTGFAGPATPDYSKFKKDFDHTVRQLLNEI